MFVYTSRAGDQPLSLPSDNYCHNPAVSPALTTAFTRCSQYSASGDTPDTTKYPFFPWFFNMHIMTIWDEKLGSAVEVSPPLHCKTSCLCRDRQTSRMNRQFVFTLFQRWSLVCLTLMRLRSEWRCSSPPKPRSPSSEQDFDCNAPVHTAQDTWQLQHLNHRMFSLTCQHCSA